MLSCIRTEPAVSRPTNRSALYADFSLQSVTAGLLTVLVSVASSVVIVFEAARRLGADQAQISSWMWALGLGLGLTCIGLSLRYRVPVVTAWSTPGAAMLAAGAGQLPLSDAIGAFMLAAALSALLGFSGLFARLMRLIPPSLAAGMLAGVLLHFGLGIFTTLQAQWLLPASMLAAWLLGRRLLPRYAVLVSLLAGVLLCAGLGQLASGQLQLSLAMPQLTLPTLSLPAIIGIALPLLVVTMASQNLPGVATMQAAGYQPPVSPIIGWIGVVNLVLAPFGAFALNLAAITAAICLGPDAHPDQTKRYTAAISAGLFYLLVGLLGASVAALLAALPVALIACLAGIALLGTLGSALATAMAVEEQRDAALMAFLITASGVQLMGIGSAFWGLIGGGLTLWALRRP